MSKQTTNLQLTKPDENDYYDISVQNENMDKIDETVHSLSTNVEELKKSVSDGKALVANAITAQGVATSSEATFDRMATNIIAVGKNKYNAGANDTKKGTATASQVLTGYTFTNASSVGASGTMANNGAISQTLNAGGSYTIPSGYHNGSGKVIANSLSSQTSGTASASQILSGATAWVNGSKVTGTMTNHGSTNILTDKILVQDTNVYFNIPNAGYCESGSDVYTTYSSLASSIGLTASKIVTGNTILGVSGTASKLKFATGTINALASESPSKAMLFFTSGIFNNNFSLRYFTVNCDFTPQVIFFKTVREGYDGDNYDEIVGFVCNQTIFTYGDCTYNGHYSGTRNSPGTFKTTMGTNTDVAYSYSGTTLNYTITWWAIG